MNSKALLALLPALLLACGGGDDPAGTGGAGAGATGGAGAAGGAGGAGGTGGTGMAGSGTGGSGGMTGGECVQSAIVAKEVNNYSFTSDIQLTPIKIKSNTADLTVDWSAVTTDFLGHPTDPMADIDSVLFVMLNLSVEEFEMHLNADDGTLKNFNQGALQLITENMVTSGNLQDFIVPDTMNTYRNNPDVKAGVDANLDPTITDPTNHIVAVMPSEGTNPGAGSRMIQVFTVDPMEANTTIALKPNTKLPAGMNGHDGGTTGPSMSVTYDVDLTSLTPVMVPAAKADLSIDWAEIMTNGLDREWLKQSIYMVSVGHYTQTLAELETQFLDLETIADKMYSKIVLADEPMPLSSLTDEGGNAFTGIDATGTWVLALFCDPRYCGNPAPWYLTVLKPCN
jgi:hypothetical protein